MRFSDYDVALVLSGGAALGAYEAGVYEALHEAGLLPGHVAGASIGAINGTLIAGNHPDERVARLRRFWDRATESVGSLPAVEHGRLRRAQAHLAGLRTKLLGRPGFLAPQWLEALAPIRAWRSPGLSDLTPMLENLRELVEFPGPGHDGVRLTIQATDLATGAPVRFDSRERQLAPPHVRASASLIPDFPPTEIDGRLLCDGGFSENLPLRAVFGALPERPLLCIAVDLMPSESEPHWSLDGMIERQQNLQFASQTRALIEAVTAELTLAAERAGTAAPSVLLAHLVYRGQEDAGAQKAYDFSRRSIGGRWQLGLSDARAMVADLAAAPMPTGGGLTIRRFPEANSVGSPIQAKAA